MKIKSLLFGFILITSVVSFAEKNKAAEIYQIKVYSMKTMDQVNALHDYLKNAYLPALHKMGIKNIGVFTILGIDTAVVKKVYVLVPFASVQSWKKTNDELELNRDFKSAAHSFTDVPAENAPYSRLETILTEAFPRHLNMELPALKNDRTKRIYELRSYESPTEHLFERKVTMFNQGDEIGLFKRLNFNAIFYSSVIAGSKMPNLMYMTSFEDMADHDAHWKAFVDDAQWKKISTMPDYENKTSVSHIDITLMHATDYADF